MDVEKEIADVNSADPLQRQESIAFRDAHWATRSIAVGIGTLVMWRCIAFVNPDLMMLVPQWLIVLLFGLAPQVFLLAFPFFARRPRVTMRAIPGAKQIATEFLIAVPIVILAVVAQAAVSYAIERLAPGNSLPTDSMKEMAKAMDQTSVYVMLAFAITFAPIAEETFFRGFLYNAFRARMPLVIAVTLQSFIFGFGHFFGTSHAIVATGLGLIMTLVYEWRKTLVTPIFVHMGNNLLASIGVLFLLAQHANGPVLGIGGDPRDTECVIHSVMPGSGADEAELFEGDVIIVFGGTPVRDFTQFIDVIQQYQPGDAVPITIRRHDIEMNRTVVLQKRGDP